MARINIEDKFWVEVVPLVLAMSDQDRAIGHAIRFFRFAQEKHKDGRLITEDEFLKHGFSDALIPLFAERVEGGIRAAGAEKHFGWLLSRQEAGRKGGSKPKQTKAKQNKPRKIKQTEASYSSSSSSSLSDSGSSLVPISTDEPPTPEKNPELNKKIWEAYSLAYLDRYGTEPVRNAKVNGQVSQLAKRLGDEAPDVARYFLGHDKSYYVSKMHDVGLLLSDAEALRTQWATGRKTSQTQAQQADQSSALKEQLKRFGGVK